MITVYWATHHDNSMWKTLLKKACAGADPVTELSADKPTLEALVATLSAPSAKDQAVVLCILEANYGNGGSESSSWGKLVPKPHWHYLFFANTAKALEDTKKVFTTTHLETRDSPDVHKFAREFIKARLGSKLATASSASSSSSPSSSSSSSSASAATGGAAASSAAN